VICTAANVLLVLLAYSMYQWTMVQPKVNWSPVHEPESWEKCPSETKTEAVFFGATSMLGKYIVETYRRDPTICIINFGRSKCKECHINIKGDLRDTRHVRRVLKQYNVDTVLTSVKPPLTDTHYKVYIELNLLSMVELIRAAKDHGVKYFIYVGSIAAASHFIPHKMAKESDPQPYLTDYEAPYDTSKRLAEDFLLSAHEPGVFNTISIRTSGIVGGPGDPYDFYLSGFPFVPTFNLPSVIDANYAGNIADALYVVDRAIHKDPTKTGQFYYYTGEHTPERFWAEVVSQERGVPVLELPTWLVHTFIKVATYLRFEHDIYNIVDLVRMAAIEQTFDQTKFHNTFPEFKPKYAFEQALRRIFKRNDQPSEK